jgi:predicted permease
MTARVAALFTPGVLDRDLDDELESHLTMLVDEYVRRGMSPDAARRAAMMRLGNPTALKERHRDARALPLFDSLQQDVRHGLRTLRRDAGLAAFAVLTVGLGVGASATVFSTVSALLVRPLPFDDPDRLVWIRNDRGAGLSGQTVQVGHLLDFRARNRSFQDVAAYFAFYGVGDSRLTGAGEPERLTTVPVSENFFRVLGVQPALGRLFTAEECRWNGPRAVLASHQLWVRRLGSDAGIVGRLITLDGEAVTVVGVMPPSFDFGSVLAPGRRVDLYSPFPLSDETNRWGNTLALIGRLKPDATLEAAQAEAAVLGERLTRDNPRRNVFRPVLMGLREHVSGGFQSAMAVLACAVAMVMLIVCANLSNLLLARSATRQKEMALRAALGAGRGRLIRQVLVEALMLSAGGGALGLMLAAAGTRLLAGLDVFGVPLLDRVQIDLEVLWFAVLLSTSTGLGFGLMPALRIAALSPHDTLKDTRRNASEGRTQSWTRRALVVSEITLASVLLAGASLLVRSFAQVLEVDPGFEPESAVTLRIDPTAGFATGELLNAHFDEALNRVRSLPGVAAAGLTDTLPLGRNRSWSVRVSGRVYPRGQNPAAFVRVVSDGYFEAMGIALVAGRGFSPADTASSERVVIVNETMASRLWPGEDPLGRIIGADVPERRVVGVVRDVRHLALERASGLEMYLPIRQTGDYSSVDLVVRGERAAADLAAAVRAALIPLDPTLPANEFRNLQELVDRSVSPRRFVVLLVGGFAGFALLLATLGIFAVVSHSVSQRTQGIGIRMAGRVGA